ncbi:GNAT family N-acetyltransferase [Rhizobium sp. PL01]|uniref:GNAT family N-acetyltransferase n=1 Tax=Rhizobium sp. PL01 TaxID=3085631 RepID=UPI002982AA73|nr:GNAT family N-acetyltransferase [Rhizobium sp. PL01]MDW5316432.1 GNAT family N-acetyltransferase [Rhizobium sp. PL01]
MQNTNFDCQFRRANSTDRSPLRKLLHTCWIELYSPHVPPDVIERFKADDLVERHLDAFLSCTEVAVVNGDVIGSISHCSGAIHGLFVRKDFRGKRIGSSLLFNAEVDGARLLEVASFNTPAIWFYRRSGWKPSGRFSDNVYDHSIIMFSLTRA